MKRVLGDVEPEPSINQHDHRHAYRDGRGQKRAPVKVVFDQIGAIFDWGARCCLADKLALDDSLAPRLVMAPLTALEPRRPYWPARPRRARTEL
jgi:hypothetical protein